MRVFAWVATLVAGCHFSPPPGNNGDDAPSEALVCVPGCTADGTKLQTCTNNVPDFETCDWGCGATDANSQPHCRQLIPTGGGAIPDDTANFGELAPVTLAAGDDIDSNGTIANHATSEYQNVKRNSIRVFRFKQLTITGAISLIGKDAIVLISDDALQIDGVVTASGTCQNNEAGPGGLSGGADQKPGEDQILGGKSTDANGNGGGGGANAGAGGIGNGGNAGGAPSTDVIVAVLLGGGGGGGGKSNNGGGGGGALQLISNKSITINGGINAGGCGGKGGTGGNDGGGGGGAGGTIVLEAPLVMINGTIAANGGSGGTRGGGSPNGENGKLSADPATLGGGPGAAGTTLSGGDGGNDQGGGGGSGRMRANTRSASEFVLAQGAVASPAFTTAAATSAVANLQ